MADLKGVAQGLLEALRAAGQLQTALDFEARFSASGWALTPGDLAPLMAALQPAVAASMVEDNLPGPAGVIDEEELHDSTPVGEEDRRSFWAPWASFLRPLRRGEAILDCLDRLLRAATFDAAAEALSHLFVKVLGYEARPLDETPRLGAQTTLLRVQRIAEHRGFVISLVKVKGGFPYPNNFSPVFQLHPRGLVLSITPGGRILRVVYSHPELRNKLRQRTLAGPSFGRSPQDTLLVWTYRFARLTPERHDTDRNLLARTWTAFGESAANLASDWESAALPSGSELPGIPWLHAPSQEIYALLQPNVPHRDRWHWGLMQEVRCRLPLVSRGQRATIALERYEVTSLPSVPAAELLQSAAFARGTSLCAEITLHLRVTVAPEEGGALETRVQVGAVLPVPDQVGRFLLEGSLYAHRPICDEQGRFPLIGSTAWAAMGSAWEDLEETQDVLGRSTNPETSQSNPDDQDEESESSAQEFEGEAEDDEKEVKIAGGRISVGASLGQLLQYAIGQRLGFLHRTLRHAHPRALATPQALLFWLTQPRFCDPAGRLRLASHRALRQSLVPFPFDDLRPESQIRRVAGLKMPDGGYPPSWACPQLSSLLEAGNWAPISGARLHPCGQLAVPSTGSEPYRLRVDARSGLLVNPRFGDTPESLGPRIRGWLAPQLDGWRPDPGAPLFSGLLSASPLPMASFALRPGLRLEARLSPLYLRIPATEFVHIRDVPRDDGLRSEPPRILPSLGELVSATTSWLAVPRALEPAGEPGKDPYLRAALVFAHMELQDSVSLHCLPPDIEGVVTRTSVEPILGFDGLATGWRCLIAVRPPAMAAEYVVTVDGTRFPISAPLPEEDAPYGADGTPVAGILYTPVPLPPSDAILFDGVDGDWLPESAIVQGGWLAPGTPSLFPDHALRHRTIDGSGRPSSFGAPHLTEGDRRWLAAAHPRAAWYLGAVERRWSQDGESPPWLLPLSELLMAAAWGSIPETCWAGLGEARRVPTEGPDPQRLHIRGLRRVDAARRDDSAVINWRCVCGALTGVARQGEGCIACGDKVSPHRRRPQDIGLEVICLPTPVIHPWRFAEAGALLGLTEDECRTLVNAYGTEELMTLLSRSCADPLSRIQARLSREPNRSLQRPLGRGLAALRSLGPGVKALERILLRELVVLPPRLLPAGLAHGAPQLVASELILPYRRVRLACKHWRKLGMSADEDLRSAAWVGLQQAVCAVFGPREGAEPYDASLAGLLHRVWPLTRPDSLAFSVPGLFQMGSAPPRLNDPEALIEPYRGGPGGRGTEPIDTLTDQGAQAEALARGINAPSESGDDAQPTREDDGGDAPQLSDEGPSVPELNLSALSAGLYLMTREGAQRLPSQAPPSGPAGTESFWRERQAHHLFLQEVLPTLALVLTRSIAPVDGETMDPEAAPRASEPAAGLTLLSALMAALGSLEARPSALLEILLSPLPLNLPRDPSEAAETLRQRVGAAFPTNDKAAQVSTVGLTHALLGWWSGPISLEHPLGWQHTEPAAQLPHPWRRALPPLSSAAWQLLPETFAFQSPLRWLDLCGPTRAWPLWAQLALGLPGPQPALVRWPNVAAPDSEPDAPDGAHTNADGPPAAGPPTQILNPVRVEDHTPVEPAETGENDEGSTPPSPPSPEAEIAQLVGSIVGWLTQRHVGEERAQAEYRGLSRPCPSCGHGPGFHKCCPRCGTSANGQSAIQAVFGFRNTAPEGVAPRRIPQPWCRVCRTAGRRPLQTPDEEEDHE